MKCLLIDANGNFVRNGKQWQMTSGLVDYVSIKIQIALKKFQGEYYLDSADDGIPYFTSIFGKGITQTTIDSIFKNAIMGIDHVVGLNSFKSSMNPSTRTYSLTFSAKLSNNETLTLTDLSILSGGY